MAMTLRIRAADAADVAALHRIRLGVRENRLSNPEQVTETSYLPYLAAGTAWVAEDESGPAGFAILDREAGSVWALFVDPRSEGAGVGRALHDRMLAWARERGLRKLWLSTSGGTRAERFYRRAGWLPAGVTATGEVRLEMTLDA
jgi:GNAT superfamily N-acetyltransferase